MSILCYHAVEEGWESPLAVDPELFAAHCAWLAGHRRVVDLDQAVRLLDRRGRLPSGTVALSFDDGFASVFDHAFPVLARHRLPATVFLVAETLTPPGRAVDWVDTPPPRPLAVLSEDQVREMQRAGIGFGSHSFAHRDLTTLDEGACEADLRKAREVLEGVLGKTVPLLAYPRGRHDQRVRRSARRAGYSWAFSLPEAPEPVGRWSVPRVGVFHGNRVEALKVKSARWYGPLRRSRLFPVLRRASGRPAPSRGTGG